jgi:hypothetical protein
MQGKRTLVAVAGCVAVSALAAPAAFAEERTCRGTIGAATVDNLRVPDGATCTLRGTYVKGTVKVERNATLDASNVRVVGNVQGENARAVTVRDGSRVGGSVQVKQGGRASVADSFITHDIQYDQNRGSLSANRNRVGGSIQAFQNAGGVSINANRVDGNLQCKENSPAPVGGGNGVQGNKEDQCARL